jgi:hypothetical protein
VGDIGHHFGTHHGVRPNGQRRGWAAGNSVAQIDDHLAPLSEPCLIGHRNPDEVSNDHRRQWRGVFRNEIDAPSVNQWGEQRAGDLANPGLERGDRARRKGAHHHGP